MGKTKRVAITFSATLSRLTTTLDGGWRVSFDVSQSDCDAMMALSELRDVELALAIARVGEKENDDGVHGHYPG